MGCSFSVKNGPALWTGPQKSNQQPKPQIRLRICQMELQSVLQLVLQEKKNILPTSFSEFASRRQVGFYPIESRFSSCKFFHSASSGHCETGGDSTYIGSLLSSFAYKTVTISLISSGITFMIPTPFGA